jgi:hypothetical protein
LETQLCLLLPGFDRVLSQLLFLIPLYIVASASLPLLGLACPCPAILPLPSLLPIFLRRSNLGLHPLVRPPPAALHLTRTLHLIPLPFHPPPSISQLTDATSSLQPSSPKVPLFLPQANRSAAHTRTSSSNGRTQLKRTRTSNDTDSSAKLSRLRS